MAADTQLIYLDEPWAYEAEANLLEVRDGTDGKVLILDRTILYPQGGGQPSDQGRIVGEDFICDIRRVSFVGGQVLHEGTVSGAPPVAGPIRIYVERRRREEHAKLHTAGHLIMTAAWDLRKLTAVKGYHFPEGPYVEFAEVIPEEERAAFCEAMQLRLDELVESDAVFVGFYEDIDSLRQRGVHVPGEIPADKPTRVVKTGDYESPCGGTHVQYLASLTGLSVKAVKAKGGRMRVSYLIP